MAFQQRYRKGNYSYINNFIQMDNMFMYVGLYGKAIYVSGVLENNFQLKTAFPEPAGARKNEWKFGHQWF